MMRDRFGNTPLIVAAQNNRKRISKLCVRAGVPLDAVNAQGNSALHYCYGYGYFELGEYLIAKGADPDVKNADGLTPRDTLSGEQVRLLEKTKAAVREKVERHVRKAATRSGGGGGKGGGRTSSVTTYSSDTDASDSEDASSSGGGSGESDGNLDSYRALYSARKV